MRPSLPSPLFDAVAPPDFSDTANLAVFAESGGATIASESVDDAGAPPDSANTAKLAVSAESGGAYSVIEGKAGPR